MATVKTTVAAEVKIEGLDKAGQSVGNFRKELKAATNDLLEMTDKFGATSLEAQNAAKRVAGLRDTIGDAAALADTFNPDKKFVAFGSALQGVTAGFSAMTGAMGLFGSESKDVEKILLKVQSAMALQQGISGIKGAIDGFKLLANTIKTQVVTAFSTMKGAILATGLGALVIAVAAVVEAFSAMSDAAEEAAESQKKLNEETKRFAEIGLQGELEYLNRKEKLDIAKAKLAGKSEQEIFNIQQQYRRYRIAALQREYDESKGIDEAADARKSAAIKNAIVDVEVAEAENIVKIREIKAAADKAAADELDAKHKADKEKLKAALESLRQLQAENRQKEITDIEEYGAMLAELDQANFDAEIQRLRDNEQRRLETKAELAELAVLEDPDSIENKIAKINADLELELAALAEGDLRRQILAKEASNAIVKIKEEEVEAKKQLQLLEVQQVQSGLNAITGALDGFAEVAGRQSAAGKALSIAVTVIKTIQGGVSAFMGMVQQIPGPVGIALGAVAAAGVVASGYASISKMKAVPIPGKGGGSGGATPTAPTAPIVPRPQTTTLDQASVNAVGNAAARSYVLETDVTNNQERIRRLNRAARIN